MREAKSCGFRMLPSYYEVIRELPDADRLSLYDAIMDYGFCNEIPELSPVLNGFFILIRPSLDKSIRFEIKQKENGSKGGRPSKTQKEPRDNPSKTQKEANENLDIDIANDIANDITNEKKTRIRKFGEYGWVKLTDAQYLKLLDDLGVSELERCIQYVDESAQQTGNRNRWRDWNLVIRRCHRDGWGQKQSINQQTANEDWMEGRVVVWNGSE